MEQEEFCKDCHLKHDCQEVYKRLGSSDCPSVLSKTLVAFLLPMVIFIVSLVIFENVFSGESFSRFSQTLQSVFGLFAALAITAICMLIVKLVNRLFRNFPGISKIKT